jgi:hypothetical protein
MLSRAPEFDGFFGRKMDMSFGTGCLWLRIGISDELL